MLLFHYFIYILKRGISFFVYFLDASTTPAASSGSTLVVIIIIIVVLIGIGV